MKRQTRIREVFRRRFWPHGHAHRVLSAMVASVILSGAAIAAGTPAAQAASCSSLRAGTVVSSVSQVSYKFSTGCSDGLVHITGSVYDVKCDGREAFASFDTYTVPQSGGTFFDWEKTAHADNGCGSSGTFNLSGTSPTLGSGETWELAVCVYAKNSTGSSGLTCVDIYQ